MCIPLYVYGYIHVCLLHCMYTVCTLLYNHVCLSSATLCVHLCMSAIVYMFTPMYMWLCDILCVHSSHTALWHCIFISSTN